MVGRTYRYMEKEPLYPFGFGLSYTTFAYREIELSNPSIAAGDSLDIRVAVQNTGERAAEEVVQLYVSDLEASVRVPLSSLGGFRRVRLEPGERRDVRFTLGPEDMELVDEQGRRVLEPGRFAVTVGGASPGKRAVALGAAAGVRAEFSVE